MKQLQENARKSQNNAKKKEKEKLTIYFRMGEEAFRKPRPAYPPYCSQGKKCTCVKKFGKNVGRIKKKAKLVQVVETSEVIGPPSPRWSAREEIPFEAVAKKKICKPLVFGVIENERVTIPVVGSSFKPKKKEKLKKPVPLPTIKLKPKKITDIVARTASKPIYKIIFSKLDILKWKIFKFGEKGSGTKAKGDKLQDFYSIRDECLKKGIMFQDPEFPADNSSISSDKKPVRKFEWKRPKKIVNDPRFFVDGFSRFDIVQGYLPNCWLLAAIDNLTLHKNLFLQVVPDDQDFREKYAGIFHFRFWKYGRWIDIVVDDRLPTFNGQLVFLHSSERQEFWSALLEKAYAKLHGSYQILAGGTIGEAMEDFTGGLAETLEIHSCPLNMATILLKAFERSSLMGCGIEPDSDVVEERTSDGLVKGHAYSITKVCYIDTTDPRSSGTILLLRLRNPWGNDVEWNGPWSDRSFEWRSVSKQAKTKLGLTFDNDGEFWMSYADFTKHFSQIEICHLNPHSFAEREVIDADKKRWEVSIFDGEWVRGISAGGCRNFIKTFACNPQYRITLTEMDEDETEYRCTIIIALMQKTRRQHIKIGTSLLIIGFAVYHLQEPDALPKPLDTKFFSSNSMLVKSDTFLNIREVVGHYKLPPGTYCIVPSTYDPNEEGLFLLRVFTEKANIMEKNDQKIAHEEPNVRMKVAGSILKTGAVLPDAELLKMNKAYTIFMNLAGPTGEIDYIILKRILDNTIKLESQTFTFSKDICRSMVAMLDEDRTGMLNFQEFKKLWRTLQDWKKAWTLYDSDNSGTFNSFELRKALNDAGYSVNNSVLKILMLRFGNHSGEISFEDFLICVIKLKIMIEIFKEKVEKSINIATFTKAEWLELTLYS